VIKLYGIAQSRAVRNLWLLEEMGLPYEQVKVGFENRKVTDPQVHAINPNRKLPTIVDDDGTVLFESLAINLYLADKYGGALKWANAAEAGRCYQWSLWAANEIEMKSQNWGYARFVAPEPRDPKAIAAAAADLHEPLSILDGALTGKHYLAADRFTVADVNVASVLYRLLSFEDLHKYSEVKAWMDRCWGRPAAQKCRKMREA
jgi:glutathione S-transferase